MLGSFPASEQLRALNLFQLLHTSLPLSGNLDDNFVFTGILLKLLEQTEENVCISYAIFSQRGLDFSFQSIHYEIISSFYRLINTWLFLIRFFFANPKD